MNPSPMDARSRCPAGRPLHLVAIAGALALGGCSSLQSVISGDTLDYRSAAQKTAPLDVPPDLTQLSRDGRYAPQSGVISASSMQQAGVAGAAAGVAPAAAVATVAPSQVGDVRIERQGNERWLVTSMTPEQIWPQLEAFWKDTGFTLIVDNPQTGVMETDWAENRAKLPQDIIRNTIGRVLDSIYSTGERDKFRTRVERSSRGTEIYVSHRGLVEELTGSQKDQTMWTAREPDPGLEAEILARLMVKLGSKEDAARSAVAATAPTATPGATPSPGTPGLQPSTGTANARLLTDQPGAALEVNDNFDRSWRRVGLALDRGGFTVEDRDRAGGTYYVRYVDPKNAGSDEPNFFQRMWTNVFGESKKADSDLLRYRIVIKTTGDKSVVSVSNSQGAPDNSENAKRIVSVLVDDLK